MEGEFELSWDQKVHIHENAIHVATTKLYEAQQERATWNDVVNATKAVSAENNAAKQQLQTHGLTVLYCQKAIEHHRRRLAEARKMIPPETDTDDGDSLPEPAAILNFADRAAGAAD